MKRLAGVLWLGLACVCAPVQAEDLVTIYALARQNEPLLRQARAVLDSVKESEPIARSALLPNIAAGSSLNRVYSDTHKSPTGFTGTDNFNDANLSLSLVQPLYRRDRWIRLEQTRDLISGAQADYEAAQQDLVFRTSDAYFRVLYSLDNLRFATANREATARQLDQAKQRFDVGLVAKTDVLEAQASFDGARATEIAARNAVDNTWEALLQIIGYQKPMTLARLKANIPLDPPTPDDINAWAENAQQNNLGILAAKSGVEVARKAIDVEQSGHYPTLDFVTSYSYDDTSGNRGVRTDTGVFGLQLSVPLYQGGGVTARTNQAGYNLQAAQEGLDAKRRTLERNVKDAFHSVASAIIQVEALKATVVSSRSALEATQAGYEVGTRTIIDVLNVQRTLFENESKYALARYDYILSGLKLKQAASILGEEDVRRINAWLEPAGK